MRIRGHIWKPWNHGNMGGRAGVVAHQAHKLTTGFEMRTGPKTWRFLNGCGTRSLSYMTAA